jgi:predicted DNA-binding WGR domain protein
MPRIIKSKEITYRFEMVEGIHFKFWEYSRVGNQYLARWGRIGKSIGGSKTYTEEQINKLVKEKCNKGYRAVYDLRS